MNYLRKVFFVYVISLLLHFTTQQETKGSLTLQHLQKLIASNTLYDFVDGYIEAIYSNYTGNPARYQNDCKRTCRDNDVRVCYYNWYLENYQAMGVACGNCARGVLEDCFNDQCIQLDGVEKGVYSTNRRIPGPLIEVCKNDLIVVDIMNTIIGTEVTVHWHGIRQRNTQYMDGVPFVTQCPILDRARFVYAFIGDIPGTYFWHSHSGHNKAEGHYGGLVIRAPRIQDPHRMLYDVDDNVLVIADPQHNMATLFDPGLPTRPPGITPDNLLVNGKGKFTSPTGERTLVPYELLSFRTGLRYRIRIINSGSEICPVQIQIQDHNMTAIATDGADIRPRVINSLIIYAGERYDVVVNADKAGGVFWMHFRGRGICTITQKFQLAVIAYNVPSTTRYVEPVQPTPTYFGYPDGIILNHPNVSVVDSNIHITDLVALDIDRDVLNGKPPDVRIVISFSNRLTTYDEIFNNDYWLRFLNFGGNITAVSTMDGIQGTFPATPYILQRRIKPSTVCDQEHLPPDCNYTETFCTCHHLRWIPYNALTEIVLIDESTIPNIVNHGIHLHGFTFYATEMAQGLSNGTRLTKKMLQELESGGNKITKDVFYAPLKDTIAVPSAGYAVIRFRADNPGFWAMHCHFDVHMLTGMIMAFHVDGYIPPPPPNFPVCGDFPRTFDYAGYT